ncbi:MAG: cyclase/dehydrase, partial [Mucilaginibacter polytrichastri]|nr:cyclase/dehydrase [Mucilaginibacter polytrichastri]
LALSGGYLLYRGASGKCSVYDQLTKANEQLSPIIIETSLEVDKPREEVYAFWRNLQNLPLFMRHIKSINELDAKRSVWELDVPGNLADISWEARIVKEDKNNFLSWSSAEDAVIENSGRISFADLPDKKGTRLDVFISYRPPVSALGSGIAKLLNPVFRKMIANDVAGFKTYIEKT